VQNHDTLRGPQNAGGTGTFITGMLCGAAVGAALGLLYARQPGDQLRTRIADQTDALRRRASKAYTNATRAVSSAVNMGRDAVTDAASRGREAYQAARTQDATRPNGA
jgi:gas vesicle protein